MTDSPRRQALDYLSACTPAEREQLLADANPNRADVKALIEAELTASSSHPIALNDSTGLARAIGAELAGPIDFTL